MSRWNITPHCTTSLNCVENRVAWTLRGPGLVHTRHTRHASTTALTSANADGGARAWRNNSA
eukprot:8948526-Lingulodinium_polyedra.AAC.1